MYKKKGLGVLWAEKKETSRRLVLLHVGFRTFNITARWVPDVMFFLPARRVPDMHRLELYVRFRRLDTSKKINSRTETMHVRPQEIVVCETRTKFGRYLWNMLVIHRVTVT